MPKFSHVKSQDLNQSDIAAVCPRFLLFLCAVFNASKYQVKI